jgi:hypothetical protein
MARSKPSVAARLSPSKGKKQRHAACSSPAKTIGVQHAREAKQHTTQCAGGKTAHAACAMGKKRRAKQRHAAGDGKKTAMQPAKKQLCVVICTKKSVARKFSNTRDSVAIGNAYNTK